MLRHETYIRREKMKKFIYAAAVALAVLVGLTACPSPTGSGGEPAVTYSQLWIKGSFDDWKADPKHYFIVDELDSNKLTFTITGLYNDPNVPLYYEFVFVSPDNKEFKYNSDTPITPGTSFVLGDSSASGSTFTKNVKFEATKASYTVTVDISNPAAPSVNLVAGTQDATPVTDEILLNKLQIKGNQFSQINGEPVASWTPANGTIDVSAKTASWDVLIDNKNGEFGFNSLNNFLKGVTLDVSALVNEGDETAASEILLNDGNNCTLANTTKKGSIYTITVTVDITKSVADGRYQISAKLKTLGTQDWAFEVPANVYITGDITGGWQEADGAPKRPAIPVASEKAEFTYSAAATGKVAFKIALAANAGWNGLIGFDGVDTTGTAVIIYSDGGDLAFDAEDGKTYVVTIDFKAPYSTTGKPFVTISEQ